MFLLDCGHNETLNYTTLQVDLVHFLYFGIYGGKQTMYKYTHIHSVA